MLNVEDQKNQVDIIRKISFSKIRKGNRGRLSHLTIAF